jgi:hypothetical protein
MLLRRKHIPLDSLRQCVYSLNKESILGLILKGTQLFRFK